MPKNKKINVFILLLTCSSIMFQGQQNEANATQLRSRESSIACLNAEENMALESDDEIESPVHQKLVQVDVASQEKVDNTIIINADSKQKRINSASDIQYTDDPDLKTLPGFTAAANTENDVIGLSQTFDQMKSKGKHNAQQVLAQVDSTDTNKILAQTEEPQHRLQSFLYQRSLAQNTDDGDQFVSSGTANASGNWGLTIGLVSGFSVIGCCLISQLIAQEAKKSKLKLNKYYSRKKYEKDQLIQFISREQQFMAYNPDRFNDGQVSLASFPQQQYDPYVGRSGGEDMNGNEASIRSDYDAVSGAHSGMSNNSRIRKGRKKKSGRQGSRGDRNTPGGRGSESYNDSEGPKQKKRRQRQQPISGIGGTFDESAEEQKGIQKQNQREPNTKPSHRGRDDGSNSSWDEGNGKHEELKEGGRANTSQCTFSLSHESSGFIGGSQEQIPASSVYDKYNMAVSETSSEGPQIQKSSLAEIIYNDDEDSDEGSEASGGSDQIRCSKRNKKQKISKSRACKAGRASDTSSIDEFKGDSGGSHGQRDSKRDSKHNDNQGSKDKDGE